MRLTVVIEPPRSFRLIAEQVLQMMSTFFILFLSFANNVCSWSTQGVEKIQLLGFYKQLNAQNGHISCSNTSNYVKNK